MAAEDSDKTTVLSGDQTINREMERASKAEACLILVRGTPQGHKYELSRAEMTIGRDPTADICVADQSISKKHAKFVKKSGAVVLTDLNSSNGTQVNGKKIEANAAITLGKEDMIKMGSSIFKFLPAGTLETLLEGELSDKRVLDPMTKIYNKGYLLEALEAEFKRAKALHTDFSLLFFDIDHFKKTNDTFGHDAGDHVLKEFTAIIKSKHVRPKDVFARYGGEEFVLLLTNTASTQAQTIAESVRAAIEAHAFIYEGKRIPVTTSIGVAELSSDVESSATLVKRADKALYEAKQSGRNQVRAAS
ncbi:MAG: GGDEF domain-containing protein [Bdellovibrionales bacterium]|nr:GGDEF domain-containing protein [Bdellovibrionales bacterium]